MDNSDLDFAIDEISREQTRWNYIEAELESAENKVQELEAALKQQTAYCKKCCRDNSILESDKNVIEEIRDLARTGTPPDAYGMTSLEEWEHYKINRIARMANEALNKDQEV